METEFEASAAVISQKGLILPCIRFGYGKSALEALQDLRSITAYMHERIVAKPHIRPLRRAAA